MMTYKAPDGHIIESLPNPEIVTYECACSEIVDGIYTSMETTGADTEIGIQQIKIKRTVNNNNMKIEIQMSSDAELIEYINENTPPNLNF
jgi:hypothetical protein